MNELILAALIREGLDINTSVEEALKIVNLKFIKAVEQYESLNCGDDYNKYSEDRKLALVKANQALDTFSHWQILEAAENSNNEKFIALMKSLIKNFDENVSKKPNINKINSDENAVI